jgi:trehalose utilization protein
MPEIQKVIINAVKWAAPINSPELSHGFAEPIMKITPSGDFPAVTK